LLRTRLEKRGTPIGANDLLINDLLNNDLLIAAQALTLGCVIVTDNEREFSRVKGLRLQNWLRSTE
jgi:tRNA(fMet)-specific endonuclease VapC